MAFCGGQWLDLYIRPTLSVHLSSALPGNYILCFMEVSEEPSGELNIVLNILRTMKIRSEDECRKYTKGF